MSFYFFMPVILRDRHKKYYYIFCADRLRRRHKVDHVKQPIKNTSFYIDDLR
jgi:hypothetical protein